ncbi:MAG: hypothetical protein V3T17_15590 [Pseudomonadales bacterium]
MKKPTTKQSIWIEHISTWRNSDVSQAHCQQHALKTKDFYRWKNQLKQLGLIEADNSSEAAFIYLETPWHAGLCSWPFISLY